MKQTCDIYRRTVSSADASGETEITYALLTSSVKCMLQQMSGFSVVKYQGMGITANYELFLDYDTDIKIGDKIISGGLTFYVTFRDTNVSSAWKHHLNCALQLEVLTNDI